MKKLMIIALMMAGAGQAFAAAASVDSVACGRQIQAAAEKQMTAEESIAPYKASNCTFTINEKSNIGSLIIATCDEAMPNGKTVKGGAYFRYQADSSCNVKILAPLAQK